MRRGVGPAPASAATLGSHRGRRWRVVVLGVGVSGLRERHGASAGCCERPGEAVMRPIRRVRRLCPGAPLGRHHSRHCCGARALRVARSAGRSACVAGARVGGLAQAPSAQGTVCPRDPRRAGNKCRPTSAPETGQHTSRHDDHANSGDAGQNSPECSTLLNSPDFARFGPRGQI